MNVHEHIGHREDCSSCFHNVMTAFARSIAPRHGRHVADGLHCLQVNLSRWDLFHAHAFRSWRDGKLGLLFHAKEYPQECEAFPYNLGFCQRGSSLRYDTQGMDFRNLLFYEVLYANTLPCERRSACHHQA